MIDKQQLLFGELEDEGDGAKRSKYTGKIDAPIYEPKHDKPHLAALRDDMKTRRLMQEIDASGLREDEKEFLRAAAQRHTVFHYERIADYYAYSGPEMQRLMERSALVIIDFGAAIENGYVEVCERIRRQYMEEHCPDVNQDA